MISHVHSVTIVVTDQDAALDFYVNTLGWEKVADMQMGPEMRWLTVVPPGATTQVALAPTTWFDAENFRGKSTGIAVASPDIDSTYETLKERGVKFKGPLEVMPWGGKAVFFYDPDGNELFLAGS